MIKENLTFLSKGPSLDSYKLSSCYKTWNPFCNCNWNLFSDESVFDILGLLYDDRNSLCWTSGKLQVPYHAGIINLIFIYGYIYDPDVTRMRVNNSSRHYRTITTLLQYIMTASVLLEQPCNKFDNIHKLITRKSYTCSNQEQFGKVHESTKSTICPLPTISKSIHCKFKKVVLTRGSHFSTIIRRVISTSLTCRFNF